MKITWDPRKEQLNIRNHGLGFSFAEAILSDPLAATVCDRFEGGEHRWHTIGAVRSDLKLLLVVHTYPDPDDDEWVRVIGLRPATANERRHYEEASSGFLD